MTEHRAYEPTDDTTTREAVENTVRSKVERNRLQESLDIEAEVRDLIKEAEQAIAGDERSDRGPEAVLEELHWYLWLDEERASILHPSSGADQQTAYLWQEMHRQLQLGHYPDAVEWLSVLAEVSKAMDFASAYTDLSRRAPVRLEHLDSKGARSRVNPDEATPVGVRLVSRSMAVPTENLEPVIPHKACDHILTVALPRSGKDSTGARICGNLKDEHGYKWLSILDDGRNELPMIAIPSDDKGIRQSLEDMGQTPKAYNCNVYVPAMEGLPNQLPSNHIPFTIGVDTLTPTLILRLAGISSVNANTESRIARALDTARNVDGGVETLTDQLRDMAEELEATIQVTSAELPQDVDDMNDDLEEEIQEISYRMDEDEVLRDVAAEVARLAGKGLIADAGTDTNLDMHAIIRTQEAVAALSCNFLPPGTQAISVTIMDLWMRLAYRARQQDKTLPRLAMEIREMKKLAPSKMSDVSATQAVKATQQTLYELSSEGGSDRVLLVGSTQKLNEVYRPVRNNMATKLLLRIGDEQLNVLKETYGFSDEQMQQIRDFSVGQGMIVRPDERFWPINWCGARCGLGDGDRSWIDRYGIAWGARVRESRHDGWSRRHDPDWWVDVNDLKVRTDGEKPDVNPYYSNWYLLDEDFPDDIAPDDVDEQLVETVLEQRREYLIPNDLSLTSTAHLKASRETVYRDADEAEEDRQEDRYDDHDVPIALRDWHEKSDEKRENMLSVLKFLERRGAVEYKKNIAEGVGLSRSAVSKYCSADDELGRCVVDDEERGFTLTPLGEEALSLPWNDIIV